MYIIYTHAKKKKEKKKEEEKRKKTTQARIFLMLRGKVTVTESVPTDNNFKREESKRGSEPRSFCLLGQKQQQQQLWVRL